MLKKISVLICTTVCLFFICAQTSNATIMVSFDPDPINVLVGSSFEVDLIADIPDEVGEQEWVSSFYLDIQYDESLMQLDDWTVGDNWHPYTPFSGDTRPADGLYGYYTGGQGIAGSDILLGTLSFTCLGEGQSTLTLSDYISSDPFDPSGGFSFSALTGGAVRDWTYTAATVNQTAAPVPEPATVLLLGTGLIGLAGFRRKFKK